MKIIYSIHDNRGAFLCCQIARSEADAITFAKMYGFNRAARADFVRADN